MKKKRGRPRQLINRYQTIVRVSPDAYNMLHAAGEISARLRRRILSDRPYQLRPCPRPNAKICIVLDEPCRRKLAEEAQANACRTADIIRAHLTELANE